MAKKDSVSIGSKSFEDLRKVNEHEAEYWSARDIQPLLGYKKWRCFEDAMKRAITYCNKSGNESLYHFAGVGKMIEGGKGHECSTGRRKIAVKVMDIFENDTMKIMDVNVRGN